MVKRSTGIRVRTRQLFRKHPRDRGNMMITRRLQRFDPGDRVAFVIEPSEHGGQPYKRFQGLTGVVRGTQGRAYVVDVLVGGKMKTVITNPIHLKRLE